MVRVSGQGQGAGAGAGSGLRLELRLVLRTARLSERSDAKSSSLEASELAISAPILAMPSGPCSCSPAGRSACPPAMLEAASPSPETTTLSPSTTSVAAVRAACSGGSCMREREATLVESRARVRVGVRVGVGVRGWGYLGG